jgi:hypothetical protein
MDDIKNSSGKKDVSGFKAPLRNRPVRSIERNALRHLLWCVLKKLMQRKGDDVANQKDSKLTPQLLSDVTAYCKETCKKIKPDVKNLKDKESFSREDILCAMEAIGSTDYTIPATTYNELRTAIYRLPLLTNGHVQIEIPRLQLEALCLYAFDKSYDEFIKLNHRLYEAEGNIQFIKANLSPYFGDFICKMVSAIESFNHSNSPNLINIVLELLSQETDRITDALSKSMFYKPSTEYLDTLLQLMERASAGFGVNLSEFYPYWKKDIGKKILAVNKQQQSEGRKTSDNKRMDAFRYRRVFLMDASDPDAIKTGSKENAVELDALQLQLENKVKVYCIFQKDWKTIPDRKLFDYAILKVDGCPMLMTTEFFDTDKGGIEHGVFYTDTKKAIKHFESTLKSLLSSEATKIYEPVENPKRGGLSFRQLEEWEKIELINDLKAAASC